MKSVFSGNLEIRSVFLPFVKIFLHEILDFLQKELSRALYGAKNLAWDLQYRVLRKNKKLREVNILEMIEFIQSNWPTLMQLTWEHIKLVGLAVSIGILTGVPIGIYISQKEALADFVLSVSGVIMTIPSIALFGVMIPIFSIINQGIGFLPALVALILYSQLPIIRNTYIAIKSVDPNTRDAAIGMGMTTWQRLSKVELPLALPVIMAGIRMAIVLTIGIGAIAAYVGAGGLGVYIAQGISTSYTTMVQVGALAVSILAIGTDLILGRLQKMASPKRVNLS
jgi:osmoprotectant transport system permease protein